MVANHWLGLGKSSATALLQSLVLAFMVQGSSALVLLEVPKNAVGPKRIVTAPKLDVAPKPDVAPVIPPMEVVGSTLVALRRSKWWKPDYSVKQCPSS